MNLVLLKEGPVNIRVTQFMEVTVYALANMPVNTRNHLKYWSK